MTKLSRRLEQLVRKELCQNLLPVKTAEGIAVGDVLITTEHHLKHLVRGNTVVYKEIHLNSVAIQLANWLALRTQLHRADQLYAADQVYGRWFVECGLLRAQYQRAVTARAHDRADMLWARYSQSRDRMQSAKNLTESLLHNE